MTQDSYDPTILEPEILNQWEKNDTYQTIRSQAKGKTPFYFLDGPPYTNGKVHVGTAWNKSIKDMVLRYKRMNGFDVWDRAGYDMHGLPTETATMKKLGLTNKDQIKQFGISTFIQECRKLCIENMESMNQDFARLGVWMDFENAYQSITQQFIEAEWWLIKQAHEKGRLYEGLRTMTWCPISESVLAKHELEYHTVTDNSIFVKFPLKDIPNTSLIIWTTTPWTLPFNLAVMANPHIEYVTIQVDDEQWILAQPLVGIFMGSVIGKPYTVIKQQKGSELEGLAYQHPFAEYIHDFKTIQSPKLHTVLLSEEYVDTSAGTGLVHCAPGCGPEDYEVGVRNGLPPFNTILPDGSFPDNMESFKGWKARVDDAQFIELLKKHNVLVAINPIEHEYPHDWRHGNPVIFRTTKQWFFKINDLKDELRKRNDTIEWIPKAGYNAFDSWLDNLRDNSISKQRFWGTPLPIWRNTNNPDDYIVIGSIEQLKKLAGTIPDDLHIPHIDDITFTIDGSTYKRVPDVLDVWVDAGTASWNCLDYPHREDLLEKYFPADFILEGKDQIRGWFNMLLIASTIALDKIPFKSVYMHGFIQDAQGRKMSKSKGNYITPGEVIDKYGADTFRLYMIGAANPGTDLNYNFDDVNLKRRNLQVIWNLHQYLIELIKAEQWDPSQHTYQQMQSSLDIEERYILSRLSHTIQQVTTAMDSYKLNTVPILIEQLLLEVSRTYIQLIREKLSNTPNTKHVCWTLYTVLTQAITMMSIVTPFITEKMFDNINQAINKKSGSIHQQQWPMYDQAMQDKELEQAMSKAADIMQSILAARKKANITIRWPIKNVIVEPTKDMGDITLLEHLIKTYTNVKNITIKPFEQVTYSVKPQYQVLGKKFGQKTASIGQLISSLDNQAIQTMYQTIEQQPYTINCDGQDISITKDDVTITREPQPPFVGSHTVFIDTTRDESLELEGFARELARRIQALRKDNGLVKQQRIVLEMDLSPLLQQAFNKHSEIIIQRCGITRTTPMQDPVAQDTGTIKDESFKLSLRLEP